MRNPTNYRLRAFEERVNLELDRLTALPTNWDGEGAPPIDRAIIDAARKFIGALPADIVAVPAVVPSARGNLQFEWTGQDRSLELEFETPTTIHYLKWHPQVGIEEEDFLKADDIDGAVLLIEWFTRGEHV